MVTGCGFAGVIDAQCPSSHFQLTLRCISKPSRLDNRLLRYPEFPILLSRFLWNVALDRIKSKSVRLGADDPFAAALLKQSLFFGRCCLPGRKIGGQPLVELSVILD